MSFFNIEYLTHTKVFFTLVSRNIGGSGEDDGWIELPNSIFTSLLGIDDDDEDVDTLLVSVTALSSVPNATRLSVEPVSMEDWELLQWDATWLEGGGLLQQISLVYPNQVVPLQLSNGIDVARVRVLPGRSNFERTTAVWPGEDDSERCCCLRLLAETEIVVTPKPRKCLADDAVSLRSIPCRQDYTNNSAMLELADLLDKPLVSVAPNTVVLNPVTLARLQGSSPSTVSTGSDGAGIIAEVRLDSISSSTDGSVSAHPQTAIVGVASSTAIPEDCIGKDGERRWVAEVL